MFGTKNCEDYKALHDSHLKSMFIFGKTFILMEMAGIKHRGYFIYFAPSPLHHTLCSNFQDVPGITGFLQMMFKVTRVYFVRNMYPVITCQEFDFK